MSEDQKRAAKYLSIALALIGLGAFYDQFLTWRVEQVIDKALEIDGEKDSRLYWERLDDELGLLESKLDAIILSLVRLRDIENHRNK